MVDSSASASDQGNPDRNLSKKTLSHLHEPRASALRVITTTTINNNNSENLVSDGQSPAASTGMVAASSRLRSTASYAVAHVGGDGDDEARKQENGGNTNSRGQGTAQQHAQAGDSSLMPSSRKVVGHLSRCLAAPPGQTFISPRSNLRRLTQAGASPSGAGGGDGGEGEGEGEISPRHSSSTIQQPHASSEDPEVDLVGTVLSGPRESPVSSISSHRFSGTRYAWLRIRLL